MKSLRPKAKRERHSVTFFSGFFSGCSIALLVAIVLRIEARKLLDKEEGEEYVENIFQLCSLFGYIKLHMLMYAADIYFWRCYRVNYAFIFGFKKGTELGYREVFLLATGLVVLSLGGFLANLHLDLSAEKYKTVTELVPLGLLACIRRFCDEKDVKYICNGLKYLSTIVAVIKFIRTVYEMKKGKTSWMVLALISSAVAMTINTYWDIVMDWGLLRKTSKNKYLRDRLVVPHKIVYFAAMVLNVVLRLAWMQLVLEFKLRTINKMTITTVIALQEAIRRGIWSFFRLENKHLNNVGQYRALKSVPLPFSYYNEDADKDD